MNNSVYQINKGINKSIEFKGLKAQYIWWLGGGVVGLLMLFAILYFIDVNAFVCLAIIGLLGTGWFVYVFHLSNTYGQYGMLKRMAGRSIPGIIKVNSRSVFKTCGNGKVDGRRVARTRGRA